MEKRKEIKQKKERKAGLKFIIKALINLDENETEAVKNIDTDNFEKNLEKIQIKTGTIKKDSVIENGANKSYKFREVKEKRKKELELNEQEQEK